MATQLTEQEMLDALAVAEGGETTTSGIPMTVRAMIFIKRNHYNVPVKVCAGILNRSHSRVTEIAGGRDYDRYDDKTRALFVELIQAEYAKIGLVYTGDYHGNNSSKKLKVAPTTK